MECKVISKVVAYGKQRWRVNPDGSWSVMMFGSFRPGERGLHWEWVDVLTEKVPSEVKRKVEI